MRQGELRRITSGEFAGELVRVGRVYPELVELEIKRDGQWVYFCSESPAEVERLTEGFHDPEPKPEEFEDEYGNVDWEEYDVYHTLWEIRQSYLE